MHEGIKLKAETVGDIKVISALLQDAAFKVSDMAYLPKQLRFAFVANRFRWEHETGASKSGRKGHQRIRSALRFEGVLKARTMNLPKNDKNHVLSLLAVAAKKQQGQYHITLDFSGGITIELVAEVLEAYLEDITGPWATNSRPEHSVP